MERDRRTVKLQLVKKTAESFPEILEDILKRRKPPEYVSEVRRKEERIYGQHELYI